MRGILPVLTLALLSVACGGPAPQSDSSGAHLAHEAYVTAVNSNNLHMLLGVLTHDVVFLSAHEPAAYKTHWGGPNVEDTGWGLVVYHHDKDGRWRVARDAFGPDHPAKGA